MAVVVVPLILLLLGPAWAAAGPAALPLIGLTAWLFLWFPAGAGLVARGVPGPALVANCAGVVVMLVGVAVMRPATPGQAMAVWLVAQLATSPYTIWMTARVLRTRPLGAVWAGLPALGVTAIAVAAALLVPWLWGAAEAPGWLIVARLATGAPVCLLGVAYLASAHWQRAAGLAPKVAGGNVA
jgi:hypothetical protein